MTTAIVPYGFWQGDVEEIWLGHYLNEEISRHATEFLMAKANQANEVAAFMDIYIAGTDPYETEHGNEEILTMKQSGSTWELLKDKIDKGNRSGTGIDGQKLKEFMDNLKEGLIFHDTGEE